MPSGFNINDVDFDNYYIPATSLKEPPSTLQGKLYTFGRGIWGSLGLNDTANRSSPVQVGSLTTWQNVMASRDSTFAIQGDGTLWSWGWNFNGQLGLNNRTNYSSPIKVGTLTNWKILSASTGYFNDNQNNIFRENGASFSIKTDGTLWSWGYNSNWQLGQSNTTHRSSPVQVGSLTDWSKLSNVVGGSCMASIKSDGSLWSWGRNDRGNLGLGDITQRSSPTRVGTLTNWSLVSCGGVYTAYRDTYGSTYYALEQKTLAIKTDGTLWAWGDNVQGTLGLNNRTSFSSPVQVGSLTDWKQVAVGKNHALAIKTDGTLWAWGLNGSGELGLGNRTNSSSPIKVGSLTNWSIVSAGLYSSMAIKTDGTLWAWGLNGAGQLGLNDRTHRSSPVQVGSLTTWFYLSVSGEVEATIST
jgi:alpha-tubulin suppressor-like RCC1 family protein